MVLQAVRQQFPPHIQPVRFQPAQTRARHLHLRLGYGVIPCPSCLINLIRGEHELNAQLIASLAPIRKFALHA